MSDRTQAHTAALLSAIARKDRRALGELIAVHGRGLTLVATRYLGSPEDADEVIQDVFLRVWRHASKYDPQKARVKTWLYRITVNLCIDRHRRMSLRRFIGLDDPPVEIADPQPSAADRLEDRHTLDTVRAAIAALPARQRMALLLSAVAELDTNDVATAMAISPGAVEQLLVRARRKLRAATTQNEDQTT
ncbi:MAG: sigma-70 family RNA polymerase sigma factor [Paracoccaceae bacterium]